MFVESFLMTVTQSLGVVVHVLSKLVAFALVYVSVDSVLNIFLGIFKSSDSSFATLGSRRLTLFFID